MKISGLLDHLEKLAAFEMVVDCQSIRAAANRLHGSQPALSRTVAILEAAAGAPLLERSRTGVTPTLEGLAVARLSRAVRSLVQETTRELQSTSRDGTPRGALRCVCHEVIAGFLWPSLLAAAGSLAPRLSFVLETMPSGKQMVRSLAQGDADVAIGVELPPAKGVERKPLYQDDYGFFAAPGANFSRDGYAESLIYIAQSIAGRGRVLADALGEIGYGQPSKYAVSSYEAVVSLAVAGLGVAVLPRAPFASYVKTGMLSPLASEGRSEHFGTHSVFAAVRSTERNSAKLAFTMEKIFPLAMARLGAEHATAI